MKLPLAKANPISNGGEWHSGTVTRGEENLYSTEYPDREAETCERNNPVDIQVSAEGEGIAPGYGEEIPQQHMVKAMEIHGVAEIHL